MARRRVLNAVFGVEPETNLWRLAVVFGGAAVEIRYQVMVDINGERQGALLRVARPAAACRGSATSDGLRDKQLSRRSTGCEVVSENV